MVASKTATKRKAAPKQSRQALKDRTNLPSDGEDVDEEEETAKPKKRTKTAATRKPKGKAAETPRIMPETQQDPEDIEQSIEMADEQSELAPLPAPVASRQAPRPRSSSTQPIQPPPVRASSRATSAQPGYPQPRERTGSISGTERERRGGDPILRRQLKEMTKKYEDVNLKYQNLQEIGKSSADTNFDKLKRASDEKAKDATALIASLKKEIAELRKSNSPSNSESTTHQKQIASLKSANEKLADESATQKEKVQTLHNEVKSLEAKLVAARQQISNSTTQDSKAAPSSQNLNRSLGPNATDAQKVAKMKENLYSDLTGLIIRNVKQEEDGDIYDCIQTGRNGSKFPLVLQSCSHPLICFPALHFHLTIANEASLKTPTGQSFAEAEFEYEPHLDQDRDRDIINILPEYIAEEICFPRDHAIRFYATVLESMTKKITYDED
jgi:FtsZ-binding cell division protein ZapB